MLLRVYMEVSWIAVEATRYRVANLSISILQNCSIRGHTIQLIVFYPVYLLQITLIVSNQSVHSNYYDINANDGKVKK